jgi:hypothetical protein
MKNIILICLLCFSIVGYNQINRPIGSNLTGVLDWSSEYVFTNVTKQGREWMSHGISSGSPWSSGVTVPLRSDGYPLEIPYNNSVDPPQGVRMLMFFGELNDLYVGGDYRLIVSGQGQIRLLGAASGTFKCPVDTTVYVDSSLGGIIMEIDTSLVSDPIRDVRLILPKYVNTYQSQPFNEDLFKFIEDFQTIRFMDWMHTNNSSVNSWSDRAQPNYYTQTLDNGIAYEHIIDVCNRLDKNPWICIPHAADDNYVTKLAQLFNDSLKPGLKIYIEYSNEVWNSVFAQNIYANNMGNTLGYSGANWEKGWKFYSKRCADVFRLFENEITDSTRFVKVIASQAANSWLTDYLLDRFEEIAYNPTQIKADAIAVAPYFGGSAANDIGDAGLIPTATITQILDSMENSLSQTFKWLQETKVVADTHKLELMAYEGGQHVVANNLYNNDTAFVNKLTNANRNPRMQTLYCEYFNYWYDSIQGGLFCNFSSHYIPTKYGAWGVKEHFNDTNAPKYLGLKNCVFSYNSNSTSIAKHSLNELDFNVYPNPTTNTFSIDLEDKENNYSFIMYSCMGQIIKNEKLTTNTINVSKIPDGVYFLRLSNNKGSNSIKKVIISR